jgi:hypothetical protein
MPVNSREIATVFPLEAGKTVELDEFQEVLGTSLPCRQPDRWSCGTNSIPRVIGPRKRGLRAVLGRGGAAPPRSDRCLRARRKHDAKAAARAGRGTVERIGTVADGEPRPPAVHEDLVVLPRIREAAAVDGRVAPRYWIRRDRDVQFARGRRCGRWSRGRSRSGRWSGRWSGRRRWCGSRCGSRRRCRGRGLDAAACRDANRSQGNERQCVST